MPLRIDIKPRQRFRAGGVLMQNVGKHTVELLVIGEGKVMREKYEETSSGVKTR